MIFPCHRRPAGLPPAALCDSVSECTTSVSWRRQAHPSRGSTLGSGGGECETSWPHAMSISSPHSERLRIMFALMRLLMQARNIRLCLNEAD